MYKKLLGYKYGYTKKVLVNYTVSVIIPTFNRGNLLKKALQSCLEQSYPLHEIVVIDDGSDDTTALIVKELAEKNEAIKYIPLSENKGAQQARIIGIQQATGDLIAFLDSDDELLPDSIAIRVKALENSGFESALVVGLLENVPLNYQNTKPLNGYEYVYLLKEQVVCSYITLLVNRACFEKTGFPSPDFPACQDDDMVLTICKHFPIIQTQKRVARISQHQDSISYNRYNLYVGHKMLLAKYKQDMLQYCGKGIYLLWQLRLWTQYLMYQIQRDSGISFYHKSINFIRKGLVFSIRKSMALFFDKFYI